MTQETDLLRAIQEDPEDDALRLVYADWLEEYDQAERGELIRVQIELAHGKLSRQRREELTAREKALVDTHAEEWLGPRPECAKCCFERGMPGVVLRTREFFSKAFQTEGAEWLRRTGVQQIALNGSSSRLQDIAGSPLLAGIHTLKWQRLAAKDDGFVALAQGAGLANLHTLRLAQSHARGLGVQALVNSRHLGRLKHLGLCGNAALGLGLPALVASPLWPRLTGLDLGGAGVRDRNLPLLLEACSRNRLSSLSLASNGLRDGVAALAACPALRSLSVLDLGSNRISSAGIAALATSSHLASLRELRLEWNSLGDESAEALANSPHLNGLVRLSLNYCKLSSRAQKMLRERFGDALDHDFELR
jgi:uncharacterized protein (TIGR02996 family)